MPEATPDSLSAIEQARREAERSFLWSEAETPNPARNITEDREEPVRQTVAEQPVAPKPLQKEQAAKLVHEAAEEQPSALHIGEQLRRVAEQTAARAAELSARNQPEKEKENASTKPEKTAKPAAETSIKETQPKQEKIQPTTPEARPEAAEHAGGIAREELMALAASIRVEGVSIEEMFKAKRIDEEGLRRIVVAFLRGEDIRRLVADEVIRQQMRFERDPQLRDTSLTGSTASHKSSAKSQRTRRVATRAKTHAKAALDPVRLRHNANRLSNRILDGVDRTRDLATEHPSGAKTAAAATAVLVYFIILIAIIRA